MFYHIYTFKKKNDKYSCDIIGHENVTVTQGFAYDPKDIKMKFM